MFVFSKVTDGVSQDTATLKIAVRDINDNPPIFQQSSYNVSVSELVELGKSVLLH